MTFSCVVQELGTDQSQQVPDGRTLFSLFNIFTAKGEQETYKSFQTKTKGGIRQMKALDDILIILYVTPRLSVLCRSSLLLDSLCFCSILLFS